MTKTKNINVIHHFFHNINSEEKAYWLGFIYADGFIGKSTKNAETTRFGLSLGIIDYSHLEKLKTALESNHPINCYQVSGGYNLETKYCRLVICDKNMVNDLINHGCVEHKSNILEPPIGIPQNLIKHFIRGFMDGNGSISRSISKNNKTFEYKIRFCSTDNVLKWIMQYLVDNNILKRLYPLYKRKENQIVSSFDFGGNKQVKKYLDYIYKDATIWLDRKHERYIELCNLENNRK